MPEPRITPALRELIDHHLGSLDEIEVLLALFARRGEALKPAQVVEAVRKPDAAVRGHLEQLAARRFLLHHTGDDTFTYPERVSNVDSAVVQLAQMYEQRPVTLIKALYDRPSNAVLSFAEAFRVRRD